MAKVIEVIFYKTQEADELYMSVGSSKKLYVRQPTLDGERVIWCIATMWKGGYEPDTPLKTGITVKVVSGSKKERVTHFEETMEADESGFVSAEKKAPFSSEQLFHATKGYAKQMALHTYESWKMWLLNEASRYEYDGYSDNWFHFGTEELSRQKVDTLGVFGQNYYLEESEWRHNICGKTWKMLELKDPKGNVVELCGIAFEA